MMGLCDHQKEAEMMAYLRPSPKRKSDTCEDTVVSITVCRKIFLQQSVIPKVGICKRTAKMRNKSAVPS